MSSCFARLSRSAAVFALLACALAPTAARAEENGFKVGDGRLHPFFELEGRYDTAAQLALNPDGSTSGVGDFVLHFRPGLKLDVPSPNVAFSLNGALEYILYTGLNSSSASQLNRLQGEATLDLGFLRGKPVSFDLGDHFTRSNQNTDIGLTVGALSYFNDARAQVTLAPGGGALTISPGYHLQVETFQPLGTVVNASGDLGPTNYDDLNYLQHRITLENRWRFLPKTALMLDGEYDIRGYLTGKAPGDSFFEATTGITGLVTSHFGVLARVGYERDLTNGSFGSVIGELEGSWLPNETSSLRVGVTRNFQPVQGDGSTLNYLSYEDDRAFTEASVLLLSRLTLHGFASVDYLGFNGSTTRHDLNYQLTLGGDYAVARWMQVGLGDTLSSRSSDLSGPQAVGLNITSDQVFLRLTFIY